MPWINILHQFIKERSHTSVIFVMLPFLKTILWRNMSLKFMKEKKIEVSFWINFELFADLLFPPWVISGSFWKLQKKILVCDFNNFSPGTYLGTRDFKTHVLFFLLFFLPFRKRRTLVYFFNSQGTCEIF